MFIYLSKKIAIPNNSKLNCLAWNREQGFIACGGGDGLLKCLLLEPSKFEPNADRKDEKTKGPVVPSNLSMNQTLEGHSGNIQVITWNEIHQKLTSSDQNGLIIVWMLYKGSWYEEMINNRNKSVVKGMSWNSDGQRICIVYEDGAVIVGSVDGNRIWGKELKITLTGVEWSPDGRMLLFSLRNGEVHVYDNQGNYMMKVNIQCLSEIGSMNQIVGMHWYNGRYGTVTPDSPTLAICYQNGCMQIMRGESDEMPVLLDTGMSSVCCRWNHDGSIFAVTGKITTPGPNKDVNLVQFFNPFGEHVRTLKIPGRDLAHCEWEGRSLRIALAVDSYIYFANIKHEYKWTYFEQTLVIAYHRIERSDTTVCFWDTKKEEAHLRHVKSLISIASYGQHCVLATQVEDPDADTGQFSLVLCNAIGTPVDTKYLNFEPHYVGINVSHVVACSYNNFLVWNYQTPKAKAVTIGAVRYRKERFYHVDDTPSGVAEVIQDLDSTYEPAVSTEPTVDPVSCMVMSDVSLILGRESGTLQRYELPQVALTNRYSINSRPHKLALNCDSTRISVVDHVGILTLHDVDSQPSMYHKDSRPSKTDDEMKQLSKFERKDVWAMQWAADNPELLAIMEKTRMYIFRGLEPEEPISSNGYICSFQDLEIRTALLDDILKSPDSSMTPFILDLEIKSLRDTRNLLDKVGVGEATIFIEENPHPRLWGLLAEKALGNLDLTTAEAAYVRCSDYPGIQLIKQLRSITNDTVKRAEIAAYFRDFDYAEALYLEVDRKDLAIELREKLGDWHRVVQLMKMSERGTGSDAQLKDAYNCIGDELAEKQNWVGAREYYDLGSNLEQLVECYFNLEDYPALQATMSNLPEGHALLPPIAEMFASVGMCSLAVECYLKCNQVNAAVDVCMNLNQWDQAVALANQYKFLEIKHLLTKYAEHLLAKNKIMEAIELYRKANRYLAGARLLYKMAGTESSTMASPLRVKKLYVLAALMVEDHKKNINFATAATNQMNEKDALSDSKLVETAWDGAVAYHFLLLAHRQVYEDHIDAALKTALHLREYEDFISPELIFSLIALTSCGSRAFATCSRAFIKLETLDNIPDAKRELYEELSMAIFTRHSPKDGRSNRCECTACETMIPDTCSVCPSCGLKFPTCLVTGRPLMNANQVWTCTVCKHCADAQHMRIRPCCPLCHSAVQF